MYGHFLTSATPRSTCRRGSGGIASYAKDLAPLERIMRDAMAFPLYDGGNQGVRRRQLHDIFRHPGYDSMLAAHGEGLPEDP